MKKLILILALASPAANAQVYWNGTQWLGNVCSNGFIWQQIGGWLPVGTICQFPSQYGFIQGVIVNQ